MNFLFKTSDTCSEYIQFDITDNIISKVNFIGGCDGNLKAISKLIDGANADDVANTLIGNTCGDRPTSCADQLAKAIRAAQIKINQK